MDNPNYFSVITATVRYDEELKPNEKLLYSEISALADKEGFCWANNEYFAKLYKVNKKTISVWINNLKNKCYLSVELIKDMNGLILQRKIYIGILGGIPKIMDRYPENYGGGIPKKMEYNNTSINTILFEPENQVANENTLSENKPKKDKKIFEQNSKQYKCAEYLANMICENIKGAPQKDEKTLQSWSYTFDLMFRVDKIDPYDLKNVLEFSQTDSFWYRNILSADKFRKQYLQLLARMQGAYKK